MLESQLFDLLPCRIKSCAEEESPRIRPLENKGHPSGQSNKENKENIEQSSLKKCKRILEYADCR